MTDIRLIQLARIYGLERDGITEPTAREAIERQPQVLAEALFEEAAASDDVTSEATALEYLEGRLSFLGELVPGDTRAVVVAGFRERLGAWLAPPG